MKQLKGCLLCAAAALALLLAGCGENGTAETDGPAVRDPVETTAPPEFSDEPTSTPAPTAAPTQTPAPTEAPPETAAPVTVLDALYGAGDFSAPLLPSYGTMEPSLSLNDRIAQIRVWYYATEAEAAQYDKRVYDENFTAWWHNGKPVKIEVTERLDPSLPDGTKYYYYYEDGTPYFTFIADAAHGLRLYYWNGTLIRYIETVHAGGTENNWVETGRVSVDADNAAYAGYLASSWRLYQVVSALG